MEESITLLLFIIYEPKWLFGTLKYGMALIVIFMV